MYHSLLLSVFTTLSLVAGNTFNKPAACAVELDTKAQTAAEHDTKAQAAVGGAPTAVNSDQLRGVAGSCDQKREELVVDIAKKLALRDINSTPHGKTLMVDAQGEPKEGFEVTVVIPAENVSRLMTKIRTEPYFSTLAYIHLREMYENVMRAALPLARPQEIAPEVGKVRVGDVPLFPPELCTLIAAYAWKLRPLSEVLAAAAEGWEVSAESQDTSWNVLEREEKNACEQFTQFHQQHGYVYAYDASIRDKFLSKGFFSSPCADLMQCSQCQPGLLAPEIVGEVSGLFLRWRKPLMYHGSKCPELARQLDVLARKRQLPARQTLVRRSYEQGVPDCDQNPEKFLDYMLGHLDVFARALVKFGEDPKTALEKQARAWVLGLTGAEDYALKYAAFGQFLKDSKAYREHELKKAEEFQRQLAARQRASLEPESK